MKRKIILLIILAIVLIPIKVFGLTGSVNISCSKTTINKSESTSCTITGTGSSGSVSAISARLSVSGNITISNIASSSIWQGNGEGGAFELYTDENKSGTFQIGTFTITGSNAGSGTISLSNVKFSDQSFNEVSVGSKSLSITVNNPPVSVTGVTLNKTSLSLNVGSSETLTATVAPSNATNKGVTWSSSNNNVATVSNGVVKGVGAGTATITVTTSDGGKTATATVKVTAPTISVTGVTLNKSTLNLVIGESSIVVATVAPSNASNKNVTWSSSNNNVATVSNGTIKGIGAGTATITAKTADGGKTATVKVTVSKVSVTGVTLNKSSLNLAVGESSTVTATVAPSNASNKSVTWSTSNSNVATVSNGTIKGVGAGTASITAKTADGGKTAYVTVTVSTVKVTGLSLTNDVILVSVGSSLQVNPIVTPSNATNKSVTWSSSDTKIATVSNGLITGVKEGKATITAKTADGGKTATVKVEVVSEKTTKQQEMKLNKTSLELVIGSSETLTVTLDSKELDNSKLTWSSSDTKIATVSNGEVTALEEGTAVIMAKNSDGKTVSLTLTVKPDEPKQEVISEIQENKEELSTTIKIVILVSSFVVIFISVLFTIKEKAKVK